MKKRTLKSRWMRKIVASAMALTLTVSSTTMLMAEETVPGTAQIATTGADEEELIEEPIAVALGDVDLDGSITMKDVQIVLKGALAMISPSEYSSSVADVNGDGVVNLTDAKYLFDAILGLNDYLLGDSTSGLVEYAVTNISSEIIDDKLYCNINVDNANMEMFDYGISFDSAKLSLESADLADQFSEQCANCNGITTLTQRGENYVVLGGVLCEDAIYSGTIATLVFNIIGEDTGDIKIEQNARVTDVTIEPLPGESDPDEPEPEPIEPEPINPDNISKGDLNGDGMVGLDDVQIVLKGALKIINLTEQQREACDFNEDDTVSLQDTQLLFKAVLGLSDALPTDTVFKEMESPKLRMVKERVDDLLICRFEANEANLEMLQYEISYDSSKLQPQKTKWNLDGEIQDDINMMKLVSENDQHHYVFGCVGTESYLYSGSLITITFDIIGETTDFTDAVTGTAIEVVEPTDEPIEATDEPTTTIPPEDWPIATDLPNGATSVPAPSNKPSEKPVNTILPKLDATFIGDRKVQVAVSLSGTTDHFDIGVMYDASKVKFVDFDWSDSAMRNYFAVWTYNNFADYQYVVLGGVASDYSTLSGETLAYLTFELPDGVNEADFSICLNSMEYKNEIDASGITKPLREVAPALDTCTVNLTDQSTGTKTEEEIKNEDGTVTNKVTETENKADGTKKETVTETTTGTDGSTTNKVTETVQKTDGTTVTTNKETVTKPDGSVEEEEKIITKDEVGLLISILNKLIQVAENIYERLSTTEKQQIDGSLIVKAVKEVSKLNEAGQVVTQSSVTDSKKDVSGTSVEVYEYDTNILPADVEWNTKVLDKLEETDKKAIEQKGAKDYVTYDINPQSQGVKVEPKDGSVKVSLFCGNKWEGKKIKVFDFEKNVWLDAVQENGYVSFEAEHFSKYAIAEVADVKRGDVNLDGSVTLLDAQGALKAALKIQTLEGDAAAAADVDGDGSITLLDAQMVLKAALIIIEL